MKVGAMYLHKTLLLRMPPEMHADVVAEAQKAGLSLNEYIKRAIAHLLASESKGTYTITETKTTETAI